MALQQLLLLVCLSLHSCSVADAAIPKDYRQKWQLTRQDIVVAMPVDKNHLTLAKGSRVWRQVRAILPNPCVAIGLAGFVTPCTQR